MAKFIEVPVVTWALGDIQQENFSGVTISVRPLYYRQRGQMVRIGSIKRDYADVLIHALNERQTDD
jgi:hypothetical protein